MSYARYPSVADASTTLGLRVSIDGTSLSRSSEGPRPHGVHRDPWPQAPMLPHEECGTPSEKLRAPNEEHGAVYSSRCRPFPLPKPPSGRLPLPRPLPVPSPGRFPFARPFPPPPPGRPPFPRPRCGSSAATKVRVGSMASAPVRARRCRRTSRRPVGTSSKSRYSLLVCVLDTGFPPCDGLVPSPERTTLAFGRSRVTASCCQDGPAWRPNYSRPARFFERYRSVRYLPSALRRRSSPRRRHARP